MSPQAQNSIHTDSIVQSIFDDVDFVAIKKLLNLFDAVIPGNVSTSFSISPGDLLAITFSWSEGFRLRQVIDMETLYDQRTSGTKTIFDYLQQKATQVYREGIHEQQKAKQIIK